MIFSIFISNYLKSANPVDSLALDGKDANGWQAMEAI
jgi:hypothetical protein